MGELKAVSLNNSVTFEEKCNIEYGLKIAKTIKSEWFNPKNSLFQTRREDFRLKRLYARGEQPIDEYKKIICGQFKSMKWQNLNFEPLKLMPIFVDKICNGIEERLFRVKAEAINHFGVEEKKKHRNVLYGDMKTRSFMEKSKELFNIDLFNVDPEEIPLDEEELNVYMETQFKLPIEIAIEKFVQLIFNYNDMDMISSKMVRDLVEIGVAGCMSRLDQSNGIKLEYIDPEYSVYPMLKSQNFEGIYYFGKVDRKPISELIKINGNSSIDWTKIAASNNDFCTQLGYQPQSNLADLENFEVDILHFYYQTDKRLIFKKKHRKGEAKNFKMYKKDSSYNPRESEKQFHEKVESGNFETWFEGIYILGADKMLTWKECDNQIRKENTLSKSIAPFALYAENVYEGKYDSIVGRMKVFMDNIQLSHIKIQHLKSKIKPDGTVIDVSAMQKINLGDGNAYTPLEAVQFYEETGNKVIRSRDQEGNIINNPGIQNNHSSSNSDKITILANDISNNLQLMIQAIGANQQAENPDARALYSVQNLAALNSNQATRHIRKGILFLLKRMSIITVSRLKDLKQYGNLQEFISNSIGDYSYTQLEQLQTIGSYELGLMIDLKPDAEEKQNLMNDISEALKSGLIEVTDKIDIMEIENFKEASQLLKARIKRNKIQKQKDEQMKIKMNEESQINISKQASATKAELDKMAVAGKLQLIKAEGEKEKDVLTHKAFLEGQLMDKEGSIKRELYLAEKENLMQREMYKEDRKDEREDQKATNQSKINFQSDNKTLPIEFGRRLDRVNPSENNNFTL